MKIECFIQATQDESLLTRPYQVHIFSNGVGAKRPFCTQAETTIDHLIYGCPTLTPNEFKNGITQHIHCKICNIIIWNTQKNCTKKKTTKNEHSCRR